MAKKTIILNKKAFAYYFLQHYYRKNLQTDFEDTDLKTFLTYFCRYANFTNKSLTDEKGNSITTSNDYNDFVNEIVNKYTFSVEKNGRLYCRCFRSEILSNIREEYLKSNDDFKDLVIDYEIAYITEAYGNPNLLIDIENVCSKNSNKNKILMQEYTKQKGFEA